MVEWRDIPGYEGAYQASSDGRLRSLDRKIVTKHGVVKRTQGRVLRTECNAGGYACVRLGRGHPVMVHHMVALAFLGVPSAGEYVCHNDGSRRNNCASNLRYDTPAGNQNDRIRHGTDTRGSKLPQSKLTEDSVSEIKARLGQVSIASLAAEHGVSKAAIRNIQIGKSWAHV